MKYRHIPMFLLFFLFQVFGVAFLAKGESPFLQDSGAQHLVSIEAEHYHGSAPALDGHQWQNVTNGQYAGGLAMQALPEDREGYYESYAAGSAALEYQVEFVTAGTHYVWIRGLGPNTSSDSLHVGLDGAEAISGENFNGFLPTGKLVWSGKSGGSVRTLEIPAAGVYTVYVWMRESGMVFDKLVLTTDAAYVPAGAGPAESPYSIGNPTPVLDPIGDQAGLESQPLGFTVSAGDADQSIPSLSADLSDLPGGATFVDNGDGTGSFSWTPPAGSSTGSPYSVTFTATDAVDPLLTAVETVSITVVMASAGQPPFLQDSGPQHLVSIEAENYHGSAPALDGHQWQEVTNGQYSGRSAMKALPEDREGYYESYAAGSAVLEYQVEFVTAGRHYVWIRGLGPNTSSDSLHVGLDGAEAISGENFNGFLPTGTLVWSGKSGGSVRTLEIPTAGVYTVNVWMRESGMVFDKLVLTTDAAYVPGGAGPISDYYVTMGDSITKASFHDDITGDGIGYQPILKDLLEQAKQYPHTIVNKGVSGDDSADGLALLPSLLSQYPQARYFLVQYGTNDAWAPVPSGLGLVPGDMAYPGTFKDNMQQIIDLIKADGKIPFLAKVPKAFGDRSYLNDTLQTFNMVIDELVSENDLGLVPPDFYCHFENNPDEMDDTLHPNGMGYISMAHIWFEALMDQYGGCSP